MTSRCSTCLFGSAAVDGPTIGETTPPSPVGIYGSSKAGLTGIHDASVSDPEIEVYRALDREHLLKLRGGAVLSFAGGRV